MLQDTGETDHPGCEVDIDEGEVGPEEEGPVRIGGVDDYIDLFFQLFNLFFLLVEFLSLKDSVK